MTLAFRFLWLVGFTLVLGACAGPEAPRHATWLPDPTGWTVRDVDNADPPLWVLYERDALTADVKEFRIVGVVDAEPELAMRALRYRLLDEQYVPEGLQRRILEQSASTVVLDGRYRLPFPFRDREATERMDFTHDPDADVFRVDARAIDPGGEPPRGAIRVPVIENSWTLAPTGSGQSVFITDTVHDLGGAFPNSLIYGPICDQLVEDLHIVRELAAAGDRVAHHHQEDRHRNDVGHDHHHGENEVRPQTHAATGDSRIVPSTHPALP